MKKQFESQMRSQPNIEYITSEFLEASLTKKFDLLFSSRALEYFKDKAAFFNKAYKLINQGGNLIVITKNPNCLLFKLSPLKGDIHSAMTDPKNLLALAQASGFTGIKIYSAALRLPLVNRLLPNLLPKLHKQLAEKNFLDSALLGLLSESVILIGQKPHA
jgi:ubiquinone/menaquinone biosynthesis C-methylase UbiE